MTKGIDPARAALLVMDFEPQILSNLEKGACETTLEATNHVIGTARGAGIPVIFVVVRYRPGYPDASSNNKRVSLLRSRGMLEEGTEGVDVDPRLDRRDSDPVVIKRRVSALAYTDLPPLLRAHGIDQLLLAGVSTSGVVLSTVRSGADADYRMVVVRDACADPNPAVHTMLLDDVLPLQAEVMTAAQIAEAIERAEADRLGGMPHGAGEQRLHK